MSAIAMGAKEKFGISVRIVPIGTGVARAVSTRAGATQLWGSCSVDYACTEGIFEFAALEWGPQPLRILGMADRTTNFSLAATMKSGVKTVADAKGKRVAWIIGNPTINMQTEGFLAFGGLTLDDVELVECPGYSASLRAMTAGKVDVACAGGGSTGSYEIAASPQGIFWIPFPESDTEGWARLQKVATFVKPTIVKEGAGITAPIEASTYPCPVLVAWADQDEALCYWMTKAIVEAWENYKDIMKPEPEGWLLDRNLGARIREPWHAGAVKYFKEIGKWTDKLEKRQQELLNRQKVLSEAFEVAKTEALDKGMKAKEFPDFWMEKRVEVLKAAGF